MARLEEQLGALKEAKRGHMQALAEKVSAAARVKAAQQQLNELLRNVDGGTEVGEDEGRREPPEFGRRAPALPTRQNTCMDPALHPSPATGGGNKPSALQTDNLGVVTPMAAYSPAADASAVAGGKERAGSATGRRRSRLAEPAVDDPHAGAGGGA